MIGPVRTKTCLDNGGYLVTDTGTYLGDFGAVKALTASVVELVSTNIGNGASSALTEATGIAPQTLLAVPIAAGDTLYGKFTSVKPASGKMVLYKANQR